MEMGGRRREEEGQEGRRREEKGVWRRLVSTSKEIEGTQRGNILVFLTLRPNTTLKIYIFYKFSVFRAFSLYTALESRK